MRSRYRGLRQAGPVTGGRWAQLTGSCAVLALGVVLLLRSALGSDGYSTFVSGLSRATDVDFAVVNALVGGGV